MEESKQAAGPLTRAEILSIAEGEGYVTGECDYLPGTGPQVWADGNITELLEEVAAAAAAAERKACADLVRQLRDSINLFSIEGSAMRSALDQAETRIRARQEVQQ